MMSGRVVGLCVMGPITSQPEQRTGMPSSSVPFVRDTRPWVKLAQYDCRSCVADLKTVEHDIGGT